MSIDVIAKSLRCWLSPEFYSEADIHKMAVGMQEALETARTPAPEQPYNYSGKTVYKNIRQFLLNYGGSIPGPETSEALDMISDFYLCIGAEAKFCIDTTRLNHEENS